MIYLVTGFMRSGTSAFMQALQAGGLEILSSESRDKLNHAHSDKAAQDNRVFKLNTWCVIYDEKTKKNIAESYMPYCEIPGLIYRSLNENEVVVNISYNGKHYVGDVVDKKYVVEDSYTPNPESLFELTPEDLAVLDLNANTNKTFKIVAPMINALPVHEYKVVLLRRDLEEIRQSLEAGFNIKIAVEEIETAMYQLTAILNNRKDIKEVIEIKHKDLMFNPEEVFKSLSWPIDYKKAASVIKPELYRFRKDKLVVGL